MISNGDVDEAMALFETALDEAQAHA